MSRIVYQRTIPIINFAYDFLGNLHSPDYENQVLKNSHSFTRVIHRVQNSTFREIVKFQTLRNF